jgi:hypothetical protein
MDRPASFSMLDADLDDTQWHLQRVAHRLSAWIVIVVVSKHLQS